MAAMCKLLDQLCYCTVILAVSLTLIVLFMVMK